MRMDRKHIPARLWMSAEDVVDASLKGLAKGTLFVVPGTVYKLLAGLQHWMPGPVRRALAGRYERRMRRRAATETG